MNTNFNKSLGNIHFGSYTTTLLMNLKSKPPKNVRIAICLTSGWLV